MDYIIFGLGVGATLTLAGWVFREWGATIRDRTPDADAVLPGSELVRRMAWRRFCRSCGTMLALVGVLVLTVTLIATALMASNRTGTIAVLTTCIAAALATLAWLGLFLRRFGSGGIIRPRPAPAPVTATPAAAMPERSTVYGPPRPADVGRPAPASMQPAAEGMSEPAVTTPSPPVAVEAAADPGADVADSVATSAPEPRSEASHDEGTGTGTAATFGPPAPLPPAGTPEQRATQDPVDSPSETDDSIAGEGPGQEASTAPLGHAAATVVGPVMPEPNAGTETEEDAPASGRAEAVRNLRERRMKRRTRTSRAPD